jgi:hypothetical protein
MSVVCAAPSANCDPPNLQLTLTVRISVTGLWKWAFAFGLLV